MFALWPGDKLNFSNFIKPTFGFVGQRAASEAGHIANTNVVGHFLWTEMSNHYRDRFAFYTKEKRSADPGIIFKDNQVEIAPKTTENWEYLLWGLIILGPLIYWLTDRESTTILVLSIIWSITFGYQLYNEITDDNKVTIDLTAKIIKIESKLNEKRTIEFGDVESLKIKYKSFGRYDPLGRRIQIKIINGGRVTIATIRDPQLGEKIGRALRQLIGLRE